MVYVMTWENTFWLFGGMFLGYIAGYLEAWWKNQKRQKELDEMRKIAREEKSTNTSTQETQPRPLPRVTPKSKEEFF